MNYPYQESAIELAGTRKKKSKSKKKKGKRVPNRDSPIQQVHHTFDAEQTHFHSSSEKLVTACVKDNSKNRTTLGTFSSKIGKRMRSTLKGLDIYG